MEANSRDVTYFEYGKKWLCITFSKEFGGPEGDFPVLAVVGPDLIEGTQDQLFIGNNTLNVL